MSFFESKPLGSYPSKGDSEDIPTQEIPPSNPAFLKNPAGSSENHSSTTPSLPAPSNGAKQEASGSQYNDDELDNPSQGHLDPGGYDPNMSGPHATEPVDDLRAGQMNGFEENADYMHWAFDAGAMPESRLCYGPATARGQYIHSYEMDQDMVIPPAHDFRPEDEFEFGRDKVAPQGEFGDNPTFISGIQVSPIVRRA